MALKWVSFHGIPFRVSPSGDVVIDQLCQILLKSECSMPGVYAEFGSFLISHCPDISEKELKKVYREHPSLIPVK